MKNNNYFRKKLIICLILFSLIPTFFIGFYGVKHVNSSRINDLKVAYYKQSLEKIALVDMRLAYSYKKTQILKLIEKSKEESIINNKETISNTLENINEEFKDGVEELFPENLYGYKIFKNNTKTFESEYTEGLSDNARFNNGSFIETQKNGTELLSFVYNSEIKDTQYIIYITYNQGIKTLLLRQNGFVLKVIEISIFCALFAFLIGSLFVSPTRIIINTINNVSGGKINIRVKYNENHEFKELYGKTNQILEEKERIKTKLEERYQYLKDLNHEIFTENKNLSIEVRKTDNIVDKLEYINLKYIELIKNIRDIIFIIDEDENIIFINDVVNNLSGISAKELVGSSMFDFIIPIGYKNNDKFKDHIRKVEMRNKKVYINSGEDKDKNYKMYKLTSKKLKSDCGYNGTLCIVKKISYIKENQNEEIIRKLKEMDLISEISSILANNIDLESLLDSIMLKIEEIAKSSICMIVLEKNKSYEIASMRGDKEHEYVDAEINISALEYEFNERNIKMLRTRKIRKYINSSYMRTDIGFVILPIISESKTIGYFVIGNDDKLNDEEFENLNILARQSVIAIDKANLYVKQKQEYLNTITALATAIEAKDKYTEGHSLRVANFSRLIASHMDFSKEFIEDIEVAGILHDIGKIGINDSVLTKSGRLTFDEYKEIKKHPVIGCDIIKTIEINQTIIDGVLLHHKGYDLKGYPMDPKIKELPMSAAIIGVADALDAITSKRSYSVAKALEFAISEIASCSGGQFNPEVVNVIVDIYDKDANLLNNIIREI